MAQYFEPSTDTNANFANSVAGQTNSYFRFRQNIRCRILISRTLQEAERQRLARLGRNMGSTQSSPFKRLRYAK